MGIVNLYQDYGIIIAGEGHRHYREGWINVECPFCISDPGHEGYHLGYELDGNYFVCWRCGWHPVSKTIALLLNVSEDEAKVLARKYKINIPTLSKTPQIRLNKVNFQIPLGVTDLMDVHRKYLINRNFDPDEIIRTWNIKGIGPFGKLNYQNKFLDYKYRIFIPIMWNGKIVSFDSRDITDKHKAKYMACPAELEIISHKEIIYCKQEALMDTAIVVEGPTDVWRFGINSVAVSGIKYTPKQVQLLAKMFKRISVCFDGNEPQAKQQANKLVSELKFRNVDAFRVDIIGDPGSMKQSEANYLVKQLIT
jgi:hypothetical protein